MNALLKKLEQIQDYTYSCSSSFTFIPMFFFSNRRKSSGVIIDKYVTVLPFKSPLPTDCDF